MAAFTRSTSTRFQSNPWLKRGLAGVVSLVVLSPMVGAFAQLTAPPSHDDLREYQGEVGRCRRVNAAQVLVYSTSDLERAPGTQIGALTGGTYVHLTGIVRQVGNDKIVQIYRADGEWLSGQPIGWVAARPLAPCP